MSVEIKEQNYSFVVSSTVNPNISLDELRQFLRQRRITGELRIVLNDGGIRQIILTERKCVDREGM